jgi:hypothetical protein
MEYCFVVRDPREPPVPEPAKPADPPTLDLKDPALAALLAWLLPGLGHWYQGRRAKAILFFVCIMGLFSYGLCLGGSTERCLDGPGKVGYGRAVYFSWRPDDRRWGYFCQAGVGLPALPALVQAGLMGHGRAVWWDGFMAPPRPRNLPEGDPNIDQPTAHDVHKLLNRRFELAGFFTMVAGLLNILVICDAYAGPVVVRPPEKKKKGGKGGTEQATDNKEQSADDKGRPQGDKEQPIVASAKTQAAANSQSPIPNP